MDEGNNTTKPLSDMLNEVVDVAKRTGEVIMHWHRASSGLNVQTKSDKTLLTQADLQANKFIIDALRALTPDWPVISEESEQMPYAERARWHYYWLVDPLDGTQNFVDGGDQFTVNIALICKHLPILGVVYCPPSKIGYAAEKGCGAYKFMLSDYHKITTESAVTAIDQSRLLKICLTKRGENSALPFINALTQTGVKVERSYIGSSLKTCQVAEGKADVYPCFVRTHEWDTAAAQIVLEEAGGAICDIKGKPLVYNTTESTINPHFLAVGDVGINWQQFWV